MVADWTTIAALATAGGTLILAVSTFASVRSANRAVRAAEFRRHTRDIYVPPSDLGFWRAAFRDGQDPKRDVVIRAIKAAQPLTVDVFYGDYEGGQGMISRFTIQPVGDGDVRWRTTVGHHWNIDRPDPRWRSGRGTWPSGGLSLACTGWLVRVAREREKAACGPHEKLTLCFR
jgi:hypothetical protein